MPIGVIILLVVAALIYFGLMHRVLDRMHMSDYMALFFIGAIIVGSFLPNIPLPFGLAINIGGGVVPIIISIYLIVTARENTEKIRAISASIITGIAIFALGKALPAEPTAMIIDPIYAFSVLAGIIAYVFGRSRRGAFIAGVFGMILSDIFNAIGITARPAIGTVIGGAGALDGAIIAGIIGVGLCEIIGETREKLQGGTAAKLQSNYEQNDKRKMASMLIDDDLEENDDRAGEKDESK